MEEKTEETYETPILITFGTIETEVRGSGGDESDGCSSGHYAAGPEE